MHIVCQLLTQLDSAGEEIEGEITSNNEALAEEDGEQRLLALLKSKKHSVVNRQVDNAKVAHDPHCLQQFIIVCSSFSQLKYWILRNVKKKKKKILWVIIIKLKNPKKEKRWNR